MAVTLSNYFLNPIFMIYNYILGNDFLIGGKKNLSYFLINLVLSFIISLTAMVFNEFVVLFCCGMERNTYKEIASRSKDYSSQILELNDICNDTLSENDNNDKIYQIYV